MSKLSHVLLWPVLLTLHNVGWADTAPAQEKGQPEWRVISGDLDKVLGAGKTADEPKVEVPPPLFNNRLNRRRLLLQIYPVKRAPAPKKKMSWNAK